MLSRPLPLTPPLRGLMLDQKPKGETSVKPLHRTALVSVALGLAAFIAGLSQAQTPAETARGEQLFTERCASCHVNPKDRAPPKAALANLGPDTVLQALKTGIMQPMASGLAPTDLSSLAAYLTGKAPSAPTTGPVPIVNPCPAGGRISLTPAWNGWSPDLSNSRLQPNSGLRGADVPKLKVKWTFAYPGSKNSQVTVAGDRLFIGATTGTVYSLNAKTGCTYWRYDAPGAVRAAPVVARLAAAPSGYVVYISDFTQTVHALDAASGRVIWSSPKLENHPRAMLTGAAALYKDVLYVPVSSSEEVAITTPGYICCSFRGSVVALDAKTGRQLWKTYTIQDAPHTYRPGQPQLGPAGAAVWSSPTIDPKRGVLYVTTGDSYTDVSTNRADAVVAMDLRTGDVKWSNQVTENDNFVVGCPRGGTVANCPTPLGPDHDFGSSIILRTRPNGKDILLAGQKSSEAYGLDPDQNGRILWRVKLGRGGAAGGVEWGMAADQSQVYVALADPGAGGNPSLNALKIATGEIAWKVPTPKAECTPPRRCTQGQSAPVSAIPGIAFSGAIDGHMRAYDTANGNIIWDFDTAAEPYDTVNGVKAARGGTLDATGPTFAGGMMYQHSGYPGVMATANSGQNLLMAFSVDGK